MKTLFSYAFNKHLHALACTLFFFFGFTFNTKAQICPPGLTVSVKFDIENKAITSPIPFCTPIIVTTTVKNANNTSQTTDLRTELRYGYDIVCLNDYATATDCSDVNVITYCLNNVLIPANDEREFKITVRYNTQRISFGVNNAVSYLGAFTNNCLGAVAMPRYNELSTKVLGTAGQTTTVTAIPVQLGINGALVVKGNVILNLDYTVSNDAINNGFIGMDDGASLIIPNGRTLTLNGVYVFGCKSMWNSIIVEPGGTLNTSYDPATNGRYTVIEDGARAIEARPNSTINVGRTFFRDNERSIYVAPSATGTPQSINFGPFLGCQFEGTGSMKQVGNFCGRVDKHPFAGIDVSDVSYIQLLNYPLLVPTRFRNMSNGILAKSTHLFVNRVKFENIKSTYSGYDGLGIWSHDPNSLLLVAGNSNSTDLDFTNCTQGIIYENFGLNDLAQINSLNIDNTADAVGVGIKAINNNFNRSYIYANNIRAKTGIISAWNQFNAANVGEIYNNQIDVTANPSQPWASLGIIGFDNSVTGNWNIYENFIDVQTSQGGMQFNSGTGATLTNNIITLQTTSLSNANGIQAGGSTNFNVSCNDVSFPGNPNPFFRSGIFVFSGTGSSYTCNNTSGTEFGLNIVGDCRPFTMSGHTFNNHYAGLRLNSGAFTGVQSLEGNRWFGSYTTVGAENLNSNLNDIAQSRFEVGSPNAPIMPTFSPPLSNWFLVTTGTDATCASLNACSIGTSASRVAAVSATDESFYTSAISAERMQTPNAEEMKWTAQRNAYGRLMDNPSEQNNRDKTNFVGRMRNTSMGQLYQVEKGVKDIKNIGQEHNDVLMTNSNSIKTLANEIADLDAKIFTAKDAEKTALVAQKKEKNATIHRLSTENAPRHATIERKRNQEIQRLMRDNERISANLQPEVNEKEVNRIYLETVAQGKRALNQEQAATARMIAFQCPSKGGNAVFAARSLYSLVENVNFNDLELCNVRSESMQGFAIKRVETNYKISPNPATDVLSVSQASDKAEAGEWLIFDTAGKLLLTKKVSDNETESSINIQRLSEGIYFVSFSVNGQKRYTQKLVKIKSN